MNIAVLLRLIEETNLRLNELIVFLVDKKIIIRKDVLLSKYTIKNEYFNMGNL